MADIFNYDGVDEKEIPLSIKSFGDILAKTNEKKVCVFLGAGFSKAWDKRYPLSDEVFSISQQEADDNFSDYNFFSLFETLNLKWAEKEASDSDKASVFKKFKFTIDIFKRYPSLLPYHLDKQTLDIIEKEIKRYVKDKFLRLVPKSEHKLKVDKPSKGKKDIINFFEALTTSRSLDVITTNYDIVIDKVLNSLEEKHIVRGFPVHSDGRMLCPKPGGIGLYKLNGGFEVVSGKEGFEIDYGSILDSTVTPNIILPSNEQDYGDKYFKQAFIRASSQLRQADVLIFIGYSFPVEDHIISFLLQSFSDDSNKNKETIIIGRSEASAIELHNKACGIFKDINDNNGIFYSNKSFASLCEDASLK
ncbi:SIR2 family protein [Pantoea stewartii]|uniref:SIR2 family protein n=1 Tax=Pantoea stewartii TaxID=66269 RepID=UPI0006D1F393|nr:SIR2 family protein [Pantoea stewartii]